MQALFIGQAYIDVTFLTDTLPTGDEKAIAQDYAVSFGGNAVTAGFTCAKLGVSPDIMCSQADDWLARMFLDMAAKYGISVHGRKVRESSLSFIMPNDGKRAIVRCRDTDFLHPFQELTLTNCRALHLDGHMPDAAIHYAKACRDVGILTSLDGGAVRENTEDLLAFIDVAVVSERFCQQLDLSVTDTLEYLRSKGCRVAGVTLGDAGLYWCEGAAPISHMPALDVPGRLVLDTNGAGDVFHGAYLYAYLSASEENWKAHFSFARAASAHAIQNLGNEASLPTLQNVRAALDTWQPKTGHPQT